MNKRFSRILAAVLVLALWQLSELADADSDILAPLRQLYSQGQYKSCLEQLQPLVDTSERSNPEAVLFYGLLLMKMGRYSEAREQLGRVSILCPYGELVTQANEALAEMSSGPQVQGSNKFGGTIGDVGITCIGSTVTQVAENSPAKLAGILPGDTLIAINKKPLSTLNSRERFNEIRGLVGTEAVICFQRTGKTYTRTLKRVKVIQRGNSAVEYPLEVEHLSGNIPPLSDKLFMEEDEVLPVEISKPSADADYAYPLVLKALKLVPKKLKQDLSMAGWKVIIVPSLLSILPNQAGKSTYAEGGGIDNAPGWCDVFSKKVYVCVRRSLLNSPLALNNKVDYTTLHELGHAIDALENVSSSEKFCELFAREKKVLTNEQRKQLSYFVLPEMGSELAAEAFVFAIAPAQVPNRSAKLREAVPGCCRIVRELVETYSK